MNARNSLRWLLLLSLAGCGSSPATTDDGSVLPGTDGGTIPGQDSGLPPGTDGGPAPDGGPIPSGFACTTATLLAGHPQFDAEPGVHADEGDALTGVEGRPLGWREVIFVGQHLVTVVGQEIWTSDLSAATPTVHRISGSATGGQALLDGPCSSARFANLQDLAADSDGSIYVMDQTAGAVLKITNPFDDATCTVSYWAGTSFDISDISPSDPPNTGNTNGPGLSAQFALPGRMAIDSANNLYVWDEENASIRKIASDADHTVSTFTAIESVFEGDSQSVIVDSMVVLGSSLYLYQHDTAGQTILESASLATGTKADLFRGHGDDVFELFGSLQNGGMATDGVDLFLYYKGFIYRVTTSGQRSIVAGSDALVSTGDFETDYDPAVPHPANEVQLANRDQFATAGAGSWLGIDGSGNLYFVGSVLDPYVERIACGR